MVTIGRNPCESWIREITNRADHPSADQNRFSDLPRTGLSISCEQLKIIRSFSISKTTSLQ